MEEKTGVTSQTYLRIKNIAQLTYKKDGTGQLRKVGAHWYIKIHRDRFKNGGGAYFRNNRYFLMRLRDEDGLYDMIDWYLRCSREYIRLQKVRRKAGPNVDTDLETTITSTAEQGQPQDAGLEEPENSSLDDLDEEVDLLTAEDDEEGDSFEDGDPDNEPDEVRFFIQPGGRQWLPSRLAGRFKLISNRYLAESPDRRRGLKGLMVHGPHAIRHIGATDALSLNGSWEEAARVIQDSVATVMQTYAHWAPDTLGEMAGASMQKGRNRKAKFPQGVFMLSYPSA